ncbi:MAG: hypothetical protein ACRCU5_04905 [Rhizobiaceae bacterium]
MDWPLAIERNRKALQLIIAALYALAGLAEGEVTATLPRRLYQTVLRVLRPAEAALRRLIFISARGLVVKPRPSRPAPVGLAAREGSERMLAFCLIDPLKRFGPIAEEAGTSDHAEDGDWDIWDVEDSEDERDDSYETNALPRISVPGFYDPVLIAPPAMPSLEDPINAAHLCKRLAALQRALANLPREARRLARWQTRRSLVLQIQPRTIRLSPIRLSLLRPGSPPGHRLRGRHEVDQVLKECHALALDARDRPDTS